MKTLPVAVQVYSVRDDAERDFAGTMKKIKEIGYDGVELAGLYGLKPAEIKAAIDEAGLTALSAHVPFQELVADMEGTIQQYVEIGVKYMAIPYLMEEDRPGTPKLEGNVKLFEEIAKACKATGIKKIRIHDLRHSHASYLIHLGCSPLLISERLGHEKVQTTLNTYSHLYPNKQQELVDMMEAAHGNGHKICMKTA